jgi:hypothetical protein
VILFNAIGFLLEKHIVEQHFNIIKQSSRLPFMTDNDAKRKKNKHSKKIVKKAQKYKGK